MATGRCHCGAISYSVSGEPAHHALCHCGDCRRSSGAPMVGWIAFPEDALAVTGEPAVYQSSPMATREFCGACGTGLFYRNPEVLPGIVDIQSTTLDDPEAYPPQIQIQVADRLEWVKSAADLPEFARYPG
jgi:hypothetical protein